jgi:ABC-type sugar transport system substrate-binding protein
MVGVASLMAWVFGLAIAGAALDAGCAAAGSPAVQDVIAFDKSGTKLSKPTRIGYVAECAQNEYCQARLRGIKDAATKYGFEFKLFDPNFSPAEQLKQVQNAVAEGFDGYVFAPTTAAASCAMWKNYLAQTSKPVVTVDLPMCGDADYTPGLAATVTMQRQPFFDAHMKNAFASCTQPCEVAAVGGFIGSDLFNLWEKAIRTMAAQNPNVKVVTDEPANFDGRIALRVIQDALRAHPNLSLVVAPSDDMTRGVEQAIRTSGKIPGQDVRIYSVGGTADGITRLKSGAYNETTVLEPHSEAYYGAVALVMALEGKPVNGYVDESQLPGVVDGPGTIFLTKDNADRFKPEW